ncbi:DUF5106 domain-containing protein [Sphingobacterium sp. DN00404]|uniref:DUF5106 domain-containing protein n=1 Tax=Sphingobacterium micropteri TaxID=2763501 RepID=A0ABR7YKK5_9SPHI|nr:DUF5106 domain-containing protein [Sphingobacterium micropteri]MBD1431842.1 DUF5106 domain-containing protein [Sphingobacterium micropteri]
MNSISLHRGGFYWAMVLLLMEISCSNSRQGSMLQGDTTDNEIMNSLPARRLLTYWNDFNFDGRVLVVNSNHAEQKLVDFIILFPTVPDTVVRVAIHNMLKKAAAEPKTFTYFLDRYSHYLYSPNSPMRNEGYYELVLIYLAGDETLSDEQRSHYTTLLEHVRKNQVRTVAADFEFLAKDGKYRRMHAGTKRYKMLVFYDPTCTHCAAVMQDLAQTPVVINCIENGFLDVVSVSLHPDRGSWMGYQKRIPDSWINGWDEQGQVINNGLYNIRAYPSIFLLDEKNRVLLKDAPLDITLRYLVNLANEGN